jgi:hypothetical protein
MVWRVPSNHSIDCYFCMVPPNQNGMSMKKKSTFVHPNIPSAIRPVPHDDRLPVSETRDNLTWICLTRGEYALHRSHRTL